MTRWRRPIFFLLFCLAAPVSPTDQTTATPKNQVPVSPKRQTSVSPKSQAPVSPKGKTPVTPRNKAPVTPRNKAPVTPDIQAPLARPWWPAKKGHTDATLIAFPANFAPCINSTTHGKSGPGLDDKQELNPTDRLSDNTPTAFGAIVHPHDYGIRDFTWGHYTGGRSSTLPDTLWVSIVPYEQTADGRRYLVPAIDKGTFNGYRVTCSKPVFDTKFQEYPHYYPTLELTFPSADTRNAALKKLTADRASLELLSQPISDTRRPATFGALLQHLLDQKQASFLAQRIPAGSSVQVRLRDGRDHIIADFSVIGEPAKQEDTDINRNTGSISGKPRLSPIYLPREGALAQTLRAQGGLRQLATIEGCESGGAIVATQANDQALATDCSGAQATLVIPGLTPVPRQPDGSFRITPAEVSARLRLLNIHPWPVAVAEPGADAAPSVLLQPGTDLHSAPAEVLIPLNHFDENGSLAIDVRMADEQDAHPCLSLAPTLGAVVAGHPLKPLLDQDCATLRLQWDAGWGAPRLENCTPITAGPGYAICLSRRADTPIKVAWNTGWETLVKRPQEPLWQIGANDLRPRWPFASDDPSWQDSDDRSDPTACDATPRYVPTNVSFLSDTGTQPATQQNRPWNTPRQLPSLSDMGWPPKTALPRVVRLTYRHSGLSRRGDTPDPEPFTWRIDETTETPHLRLADRLHPGTPSEPRKFQVALDASAFPDSERPNSYDKVFWFDSLAACRASATPTEATFWGNQKPQRECRVARLARNDRAFSLCTVGGVQDGKLVYRLKPRSCLGPRRVLAVSLATELNNGFGPDFRPLLRAALVSAAKNGQIPPFNLYILGQRDQREVLRCEDLLELEPAAIGERIDALAGDLQFSATRNDPIDDLTTIRKFYDDTQLRKILYIPGTNGLRPSTDLTNDDTMALRFWRDADAYLHIATSKSACATWDALAKRITPAYTRLECAPPGEHTLRDFFSN